jgi:tetratricopeptide (TPR) repeat protein
MMPESSDTRLLTFERHITMGVTIDLGAIEELRRSLPSAARELNLSDLLDRAEASRQEQRFEDAEKLLQAALLIDPEHAPTWALVGSIEDELGDIDTAREAYRRAIGLQKDDRSALALARLLASIGEWSEASALTSYLALEADDRDVREGAAVLGAQIKARAGGAS